MKTFPKRSGNVLLKRFTKTFPKRFSKTFPKRFGKNVTRTFGKRFYQNVFTKTFLSKRFLSKRFVVSTHICFENVLESKPKRFQNVDLFAGLPPLNKIILPSPSSPVQLQLN